MEVKIIPVSLGFVKSFLVIGDKTVIVDAGLKGSVNRILRAMKANSVKPEHVSLLLITHAHGDHTGGLIDMKKLTGAPVAVHRAEADFLADGRSAPVTVRSPMMRLLSGLFGRQKILGVRPDVLIDGRMDLVAYGVDGYALHTPGHTDGSVSLVTASGEAIAGDMIGGRRKPAIPGVYADLGALKAGIGLLRDAGVKSVHTSHGGVHTIAEVLTLGS